jgi:DNA repair protein RadA/Sms
VDPGRLSFIVGRDLAAVVETAHSHRPAVLGVDSIQTLRDPVAPHAPGGVAQVRSSTDALVGLAKETGIAILMTGHVTKDGDLAGPRALEHAVDVVLSFEGDARSGLRVLTGGKNRFGSEGESAWFEMGSAGLKEIDPTGLFVTGDSSPGSALGLPRAGRRALAVEIQALVGGPEGPPRRNVTGLDPRRFSLVAAVLERNGVGLGRAELFGATAGGLRLDDPACDLAVAMSLASAASGVPVRDDVAFVGEVGLTGQLRAVPGMEARFAAAASAGARVVFAPYGQTATRKEVEVVAVGHVREALRKGLSPAETALRRLPA